MTVPSDSNPSDGDHRNAAVPPVPPPVRTFYFSDNAQYRRSQEIEESEYRRWVETRDRSDGIDPYPIRSLEPPLRYHHELPLRWTARPGTETVANLARTAFQRERERNERMPEDQESQAQRERDRDAAAPPVPPPVRAFSFSDNAQYRRPQERGLAAMGDRFSGSSRPPVSSLRELLDRGRRGDYYRQQERFERQNLAPVARPSNPVVMSREERERTISQLREENKNPAPAMSRACRICFADSPTRRAVFTSCGHCSCHACALYLQGEASDEGKRLVCPFCRAETGFVPLFEGPIGESEN